jgi:hypothetical protein
VDHLPFVLESPRSATPKAPVQYVHMAAPPPATKGMFWVVPHTAMSRVEKALVARNPSTAFRPASL